jgi:hypothetical protein
VMLAEAWRVEIGGNSSGAGNQIVANPGNQIVSNQGYGLEALGVCTGSVVQGNTIAANTQGNVDLSKSTGVTYIPQNES